MQHARSWIAVPVVSTIGLLMVAAMLPDTTPQPTVELWVVPFLDMDNMTWCASDGSCWQTEERGIALVSDEEDTYAAIGLAPGDILEQYDRSRIRDLDDLFRFSESLRRSKASCLTIRRDGVSTQLGISLPGTRRDTTPCAEEPVRASGSRSPRRRSRTTRQ